MKCVATPGAFADAHMAKHMHPVPAQTFVLCTKHIIRCAMQQTAPMLQVAKVRWLKRPHRWPPIEIRCARSASCSEAASLATSSNKAPLRTCFFVARQACLTSLRLLGSQSCPLHASGAAGSMRSRGHRYRVHSIL